MKRYIYLLISAMALMCAACSENNEDFNREAPHGKPTQITISPVARTATRAGETDNELINNWWMVFVGKTDNVVYNIIGPVSPGSAVQQDFFTTRVLPGTYTVYAFANISRDDVATHAGITFPEVGQAIDPAKLDNATYANLKNAPGKETLIPMSGKQEITVTERVNQTFSIEVVRMMAKIEFRFTSEASEAITVTGVTMLPLYKDPIRLLPDYTLLDEVTEPEYTQPENSTENLIYTFSPALTIDAGATEPKGDWFYALESLAKGVHPTDHFVVQVATERGGRKENLRYALMTDEMFDFIYRNDHIIVPIKFTDYIIEPGVIFYPPIGGYPAVVTDDKQKECYITFGTQGEFEFYVDVYDGAGNKLPDTDVEVEIKSISDPNQILSKQLAKDPVTGELLGEVNTKAGTATIEIEVKVKQSETITQTYQRTIYIIRSN